MESRDMDETFCTQLEVVQKPSSGSCMQNILMEQEVMSNTKLEMKSKRNRKKVTYFPNVKKCKKYKTKDAVTQKPLSESSVQDILMEQEVTCTTNNETESECNENLYLLMNAHIVKSLKSLKEKKLRTKKDLIRNFKSVGFEILSSQMTEEDKLQAELEFNTLKDTDHFNFV